VFIAGGCAEVRWSMLSFRLRFRPAGPPIGGMDIDIAVGGASKRRVPFCSEGEFVLPEILSIQMCVAGVMGMQRYGCKK